MPKDLKHLTIAEIDSLIKRYYAGESVTKLLKEYHLTIRTTELYKLFPPEICENDSCEYCGESLVRDRLSKSASSWMRSNADIYCPVCRHRPYTHSCQCFNCIEKERQLRDYQRQRIKEVYSRKREPVNFDDSALLLWRKIAVGECLEYLNYQLHRVGFDFTPGEKTYKIFEILLNDFSVSQIYGIIWKAVADASKLYLERSITKKHAANSVIGGCERLGARAKVNGWNMTEYSRIKDLPQSELSAFFFNRVLGIGDMGFKVPPTTV